jgi:hypothetical protein
MPPEYLIDIFFNIMLEVKSIYFKEKGERKKHP